VFLLEVSMTVFTAEYSDTDDMWFVFPSYGPAIDRVGCEGGSCLKALREHGWLPVEDYDPDTAQVAVTRSRGR
jgi:hypothetical protein